MWELLGASVQPGGFVMNKFSKFFLLVVLAVFSACTFNTAGLNSQTDDCAGVDCGHGICVELPGEPVECQCESNWQGAACSECVTGYTGPDCADCADGYELNDVGLCVPINPDPCTDVDCGAHGSCVVNEETEVAGCECETGYFGEFCTDCAEGYELDDNDECVLIVIDPCTLLDCGEHGTCVVNEQSQSATCDCDAGYLGDLCEQCDTVNGYEIVQDECLLDPCFNRNCGTGTCVRDDQTWTASCDCPEGSFGASCEFLLDDTLVYQFDQTTVKIQVWDNTWLNATGNFRMELSASVSGAGMIYFTQANIDVDGFVSYLPCNAGVDEQVQFFVVKAPYGGSDRMKIHYLTPLNPADPHGFIYDSSATANMDVFRAECYDCANGGCKVRPAGGTP